MYKNVYWIAMCFFMGIVVQRLEKNTSQKHLYLFAWATNVAVLPKIPGPHMTSDAACGHLVPSH